MNFHAPERLRQFVASVRKKLSGEALILLYHRIADSDSDPWSLSVSPTHFAEHLEIIKKHGRTMRVGELAEAIAHGKLPRRALVVTFDDGYADNLFQAKPLLEKHDVPATVFVSTEYIGSAEFWWDELDTLFLQARALPNKLRLTIAGTDHQWDLDEAAHHGEAAYQTNQQWRASDSSNPSPRQLVYRSLWELMHPLSEGEREEVRGQLLAWAGVDTPRRARRPLSRSELLMLAQGDLVEIGSHSATHPKLSMLPTTVQRDEVYQSKAALEEILGHAVTSFAYPYGQPCDYTEETIAVVKEAGFDCACTTKQGLVRRRSPVFELPRFPAPDVSGEVLDNLLRQWFEIH